MRTRSVAVNPRRRSAVDRRSKAIGRRQAAEHPDKATKTATSRPLHIVLRREGITLNHKKLRRLYAEEGLQVRRRGGRKRAPSTRRR